MEGISRPERGENSYIYEQIQYTDRSVCDRMEEKETKEEILEAAFSLFVNRSYDEVTMKQVADETGVSKGAIFHYFDSKFDLAKMSILDYMKKNWMPLYSELEELNDPDKRLDRAIERSFDFLRDNPHVPKALSGSI